MNETYRFAELMELMADAKGRSMGEAWASRLGHEVGSSGFLTALAVIRARAERIALQIEQAPISDRSRRLYKDALSRLEAFTLPQTMFSQTPDQLGKARQSIDLIFLAADALPHELEPEVNELTLDSLISELDAILEALSAAVVDPFLKKLIWQQLSDLLTALRAYPLYGPDGVAKVMGAAATELARIKSKDQPQATKSIYERSFAAIKKVGAVVVWSGAVVSGAHGVLTDGSDILGLSTAEAPSSSETNTKLQ